MTLEECNFTNIAKKVKALQMIVIFLNIDVLDINIHTEHITK
jgi:hypothetical protein